ncbi:MAG: DUF6531 domain-containing protein, partial [Anaerolineaceae bacterium]
MPYQTINRWGKKVSFYFNTIIILSLMLSQVGIQHSSAVTLPIKNKHLPFAGTSQGIDMYSEEYSALDNLSPDQDARGADLIDYGAQLVCTNTNGMCSDTNPGVSITEDFYYSGGYSGESYETFNFHIDCDINTPGCTQHDIYYVTTVEYSWSTPYIYSPPPPTPLLSISSTAYLSPLPNDNHGTGIVYPQICSQNGMYADSCKVSTQGVIAAEKINPGEQISNHFYINHHVSYKGSTYGETIHWTLTVSFDPNLIADYLPEDSVCVIGNCPGSYHEGQNFYGHPINSRTGTMSYPVTDLKIATSGGDLSFDRVYISSKNLKDELPIGYGWSSNLTPRLIFSTDPGGKPGIVLYKTPQGNTYQYWDTGMGTYTSWSGVKDTLTKYNGTPVTYTIKEPDQTAYLFNENGRVNSRTTADGALWTYLYEAGGQLDRVEADNGTHYIDLAYDTQGQLISISDHSDRMVTYGRDNKGNLTSVTDVLNQVWTYEYNEQHQLTIAKDPNGEQVERNEYTTATEHDPFLLNFNNYPLGVYSVTGHNSTYTREILDGGRTYHITGDTAQMISHPVAITHDTVIEFDYRSDIQGTVQGIGLEVDSYNMYDEWRIVELWGTTNIGFTNYKDYGSSTPNWRHYVIPIGDLYLDLRPETGRQQSQLIFFNYSTSPYLADSYFRDLKIYESTGYSPMTFDSSAFSNFSNQDGTYSMSVEDNGLTLHLTGNTWKKLPLNYTITKNTVLEFDFKSPSQGEIHGIGMDDNNTADGSRTYQLYGTTLFGNLAYNNYSASAPDWKHYVIPIGQYYDDRFVYLYFV